MTKLNKTIAKKTAASGKLRIGDHWNAITIIALSQSNPLKAIAEFVENSIDAKARNITIVRGKEKGRLYLKITDDGEGIPRDEAGIPNFKYVATHICDSIKRQLKNHGLTGIQGEFGIGLLSFWTVGEELILTSSGSNGKTYQMRMVKGKPNYSVQQKRSLFPQKGTELKIQPLLSGIKQLSGDKIQWYLASELRDRIKNSGVQIKVLDRQARKEFKVEPRKFTGQLLHRLPPTDSPYGPLYLELYLSEPDPQHHVGLYRSGTRVLERLDQLDVFQKEPWTSGYLQGIIDVPYLNLTPGTRSGIIQDEAFEAFCTSLKPVEETLLTMIENQRKAEEEKASRQILRSIQRAFQEALLALPEEEYDWFDIRGREKRKAAESPSGGETKANPGVPIVEESSEEELLQKEFFEYAGPLFNVRISPSSSIVPVGGSKNLRAIPRDRSRRLVEDHLTFHWEILEGDGHLDPIDSEVTTFKAPKEPSLVHIQVTVSQKTTVCKTEGLLTITDSLLPKSKEAASANQGLPSYTFHKAPGELWRSRFQSDKNVIVINNAHRDFVHASKTKALKLRYICRLFAKELVYKNFPGLPADQLLERMIELSLYSEENLK